MNSKVNRTRLSPLRAPALLTISRRGPPFPSISAVYMSLMFDAKQTKDTPAAPVPLVHFRSTTVLPVTVATLTALTPFTAFAALAALPFAATAATSTAPATSSSGR